MDHYCVIGHPVEHSKSPRIHARFAELTGQQLVYGRQLAPLGGFEATLRQLRADTAHPLRGCNVTVPFKFDAAHLADHASERARLAGAVNTLSFRDDGVHADNTDGIGLVRDIERNAGVPLAGRAVLLIGAGGAASGVLAPLLEARPARVVVVNRTRARAEELVARHATVAARCAVRLTVEDMEAVATPFDVVINGSASSLAGAGVPVNDAVLRPGSLVVDMMYGPSAQDFLQWARAHGATPRDGLGMLVEQAAEAFEIWRGVRPPSAQVLAELRAEIG
jgi:shikimate dehydrogenase